MSAHQSSSSRSTFLKVSSSTKTHLCELIKWLEGQVGTIMAGPEVSWKVDLQEQGLLWRTQNQNTHTAVKEPGAHSAFHTPVEKCVSTLSLEHLHMHPKQLYNAQLQLHNGSYSHLVDFHFKITHEKCSFWTDFPLHPFFSSLLCRQSSPGHVILFSCHVIRLQE